MRKKIGIVCLLLVVCTGTSIHANTREQVSLGRCVDGDTTHFMIDGVDTTVRYLAINAPEYTKEKEPYGKEASAYVCDVLTNAKKIELEYDDGSDRLDKYGRTLAWVYADDELVQASLVSQGLAEVKYLYGEYAHTQTLQTLEKEAKAKQLQMWSGTQPEEEAELPLWASTLGGLLLIIIGVFFTKGKGKQKRMIKQGVKQIKRKK